ncbi:SDR family NAD(P)-dependent oxidoreductase [Methylophilus methylotrophus]|uniref:SDR family NAD(P)-dependent oxidoreductase n=1 Tax=Methylophilus methylotrophus TaxID=17 RepID=UPI000F591FF9|nr:SDR family NAD(P)-dependent oxidoreductase [Methylophilus methylotrophus]
MQLNLNGKVALVTGSTNGIGFAIAQKFAEEGAQVVLNGRTEQTLTDAQAKIKGASAFIADVRDPTQCTELVERTLEHHGKIDIIVCNVGSGTSVPPGQETPEEWQRLLDINLCTATNMVWASRKHLAETGGNIICISSICGLETLGCPVAYAAAKAALESFVHNISRPLGKHGIRINSVAPGNILFPGSVWEKKLAADKDAVESMLQKEVALKKLGSPEDVANVVTFLASSLASFITGTTYVVDGGQVRS